MNFCCRRHPWRDWRRRSRVCRCFRSTCRSPDRPLPPDDAGSAPILTRIFFPLRELHFMSISAIVIGWRSVSGEVTVPRFVSSGDEKQRFLRLRAGNAASVALAVTLALMVLSCVPGSVGRVSARPRRAALRSPFLQHCGILFRRGLIVLAYGSPGTMRSDTPDEVCEGHVSMSPLWCWPSSRPILCLLQLTHLGVIVAVKARTAARFNRSIPCSSFIAHGVLDLPGKAVCEVCCDGSGLAPMFMLLAPPEFTQPGIASALRANSYTAHFFFPLVVAFAQNTKEGGHRDHHGDDAALLCCFFSRTLL